MVKILPSKEFIKQTKKLDKVSREKLEKQIRKILENPEVGKPLRYMRGERTLYIKLFRLIYSFKKNPEELLILLKFEHRKSVYE